jgi:hypothetical protein
VFIVFAVLIQSDASALHNWAPLCGFIAHHPGEAVGWPAEDFHADRLSGGDLPPTKPCNERQGRQ